jgi:hypothetical protein
LAKDGQKFGQKFSPGQRTLTPRFEQESTVMMKGFIDQAQARAFADEAYSIGFNAHLEPES